MPLRFLSSLTGLPAGPRHRRIANLSARSITGRGHVTTAGLAIAALMMVPPVVAQSPVSRPPVAGAPAGVTAFVDVGVVPMDTERVLTNQTVLIAGGRITALGPVTQVKVPTGAVRIDGRGRYLIPGLADMHVHAAQVGSFSFGASARTDSVVVEQRLFEWLSNGVTTIRALDWTAEVEAGERSLRFKARAAAGTLWSPRIYTAGPLISTKMWKQTKGGPPAAAMAELVTAYRAKGYDFIKFHNRESPEQVDSIAAAAHRVGLPVVGHAPTTPGNGSELERTFALGYRSIEHLGGYYQQLYRQHIQPTLPPIRGQDPIVDTAFVSAVVRRLDAAQPTIAAIGAATKQAGVWNIPTLGMFTKHNHATADMRILAYRLTAGLQAAGAGLLLGTDDGGLGNLPMTAQDELEALVAAGLTPYQALVTGTRNPALYFGTSDETGTIAVGKRADLVLLTGNPLVAIGNTKQPAGVMLGGRWLSRAAIDQQLAVIATERQTTDARLKAEQEQLQRYQRHIQAAQQVVSSLRLPQAQRERLEQQFESAQRAQRGVLLDSLRTNRDTLAEHQRLVPLLARQLGEVRAALASEPELQARFDSAARMWMSERAVEAYPVVIPGVGK